MQQASSANQPSPDRETRRKHIIALGRTEDPAALAELAAIYRSETDAELRDLALHAGQFIRLKVAEAKGEVKPMPKAEKKAAPRRTETGPSTSERNAQAFVNEGLTYHLNGDNTKAIGSLAKALRANPALETDPYVLGIIMLATGREGAEALALVKSRDERKEFGRGVKRDAKQKAVDEHVEKAQSERWLIVGLDVLLYAIIVTVGPIVAALIFSESLQGYVATLPPEMLSAMKLPEPITFGLAATVGLIVGVTNVIGLFAQNAVVHVVATRLCKGKGTLRHLLGSVVGLYNRLLPILFALAYFIIWFTFTLGTPVVLACGTVLVLLFYLSIRFRASKRIGKAYAFSTGSGFLSVLMGDVVLLAINLAMIVAIYPMLASSLTFTMPGTPPPTP